MCAFVAKGGFKKLLSSFGFPKSTVYDQSQSIDEYAKLGNPIKSYNFFRGIKNNPFKTPHSPEIVSKVKEGMTARNRVKSRPYYASLLLS